MKSYSVRNEKRRIFFPDPSPLVHFRESLHVISFKLPFFQEEASNYFDVKNCLAELLLDSAEDRYSESSGKKGLGHVRFKFIPSGIGCIYSLTSHLWNKSISFPLDLDGSNRNRTKPQSSPSPAWSYFSIFLLHLLHRAP